jgi:hypothetical protein
MASRDDPRLRNQEKYLKGALLAYRRWKRPKPTWDHDHCEFCWAEFMEEPYPDTLQEGYCTLDGRYWICSECFQDFREMFGWTVVEEDAK